MIQSINAEIPPKPKHWMWIVSVCLVFISIFFFIAIILVIPQFTEIFKSFGADLPSLTLFVINLHQYFILFIFAGLIPCIILLISSLRGKQHKHQKLLFIAVVTYFVFSIMIFLVSMISMYLPVFRVSTVV